MSSIDSTPPVSASPSRHVWAMGIITITLLIGLMTWLNGQATPAQAQMQAPQGLVVLWTSGDPEVAHRVTLMYTLGAATQGWFDDVQLIVWGPSARLLAADKDVQDYVIRLKEAGVQVRACVVCADSYGVSDILRSLNLEVDAMGQPLTDLIRDPSQHILTF